MSSHHSEERAGIFFSAVVLLKHMRRYALPVVWLNCVRKHASAVDELNDGDKVNDWRTTA